MTTKVTVIFNVEFYRSREGGPHGSKKGGLQGTLEKGSHESKDWVLSCHEFQPRTKQKSEKFDHQRVLNISSSEAKQD